MKKLKLAFLPILFTVAIVITAMLIADMVKANPPVQANPQSERPPHSKTCGHSDWAPIQGNAGDNKKADPQSCN